MHDGLNWTDFIYRSINLFIMIGLLLVLFLLSRNFLCWYFKINERVKLLKEQNDLLKQLTQGANSKAD